MCWIGRLASVERSQEGWVTIRSVTRAIGDRSWEREGQAEQYSGRNGLFYRRNRSLQRLPMPFLTVARHFCPITGDHDRERSGGTRCQLSQNSKLLFFLCLEFLSPSYLLRKLLQELANRVLSLSSVLFIFELDAQGRTVSHVLAKIQTPSTNLDG